MTNPLPNGWTEPVLRQATVDWLNANPRDTTVTWTLEDYDVAYTECRVARHVLAHTTNPPPIPIDPLILDLADILEAWEFPNAAQRSASRLAARSSKPDIPAVEALSKTMNRPS